MRNLQVTEVGLLNFIFNTVIYTFYRQECYVCLNVCGMREVGGERSLYQNPMQLNCFMDKLSAKFLTEIKDTFECIAQEQGKGTCSHVCFSFCAHVTQMPCGLSEICSQVEIVSTTCQLSWSLETGAQRVPFKHMALVFPECNLNKRVRF
jgi:hypothetical protein